MAARSEPSRPPRAAAKSSKIALRRGVEEQRGLSAVLLQAAEVGRRGAEIFRRVVEQGAGGAERGVGRGQAEALKIEDAERFQHPPGAVGAVEVKRGEARDVTPGEKCFPA